MNVYVREKVSERERKREALVHAREKYISTCICQRERERDIKGKREVMEEYIYIYIYISVIAAKAIKRASAD